MVFLSDTSPEKPRTAMVSSPHGCSQWPHAFGHCLANCSSRTVANRHNKPQVQAFSSLALGDAVTLPLLSLSLYLFSLAVLPSAVLDPGQHSNTDPSLAGQRSAQACLNLHCLMLKGMQWMLQPSNQSYSSAFATSVRLNLLIS